MCEYCRTDDDVKEIAIGEINLGDAGVSDYGLYIHSFPEDKDYYKHNFSISFGGTIERENFSTINYCPMCGRKLERW